MVVVKFLSKKENKNWKGRSFWLEKVLGSMGISSWGLGGGAGSGIGGLGNSGSGSSGGSGSGSGSGKVGKAGKKKNEKKNR